MARKDDGIAFGQFTHPEDKKRTVIAYSLDDAVAYRFNGWQEVKPAAAENQPPDAEQPTEQPGQ